MQSVAYINVIANLYKMGNHFNKAVILLLLIFFVPPIACGGPVLVLFGIHYFVTFPILKSSV